MLLDSHLLISLLQVYSRQAPLRVAVSFSATFRATQTSDAAGQLAGRGVSISDTARRFGVNRSTVGRYLRRLDEGGSLAPKKAPGPPSKLDESAMRLLEDDVKARPGATQPGSKTSLREDLLATIRGKGCIYTRLWRVWNRSGKEPLRAEERPEVGQIEPACPPERPQPSKLPS